MRPLLPLTALLAAISLPVTADPLQFSVRVPGGTSYASYARVQLFNAQNKLVFQGDTDRFGRINAALPRGSYRAVLNAAGQARTVQLSLTGGNNLHPVVVN